MTSSRDDRPSKEARKAFGEHGVGDVLGKHPSYVEKLQFAPGVTGAPFADQPIIPGSPARGSADGGARGSDAEIPAFVIAMADNVVLSAAAAGCQG